MNVIGKGLVLIHTFISLVALGLALLIYFEFVDWGRAEPRISRGEPTKGASNDQRIPSEYDKSVVVFNDAVMARNLAVPALAPAEAALREVEARLPQNHLFYVAELTKLRKGEGDIEVKGIATEAIPSDAPGKKYGKPIPDVKVEGLDKSFETYMQMLAAERMKLKPIQDEIQKLAERDSQITYQLTGKNAEGKKDTHGLFELVNQEFKTQRLLDAERSYVEPQWAYTVEEARRFGSRRAGLEATLANLQKTLKDREKKQK